jgi:hypothetical protein
MSLLRPFNPFGFLIAAAAGLLHRNQPAPHTDNVDRPVSSRSNSGGFSSGFRNGGHTPPHWRGGSRSGRFSCFRTRNGGLRMVRLGKLYRDPMFV